MLLDVSGRVNVRNTEVVTQSEKFGGLWSSWA